MSYSCHEIYIRRSVKWLYRIMAVILGRNYNQSSLFRETQWIYKETEIQTFTTSALEYFFQVEAGGDTLLISTNPNLTSQFCSNEELWNYKQYR